MDEEYAAPDPAAAAPGVEVQYAYAAHDVPRPADFRAWVARALDGRSGPVELTIRIVDSAESAALNERYRGKARPTNVLSFPYEPLPGAGVPLLGDLVICAPVVAREAREQGKESRAHWAHMVVHGVLHLVGYDHQEEGEALEMEALETDILATMGFPDPYRESASDS
ncbi:MAG: rRNA maturation RNase YbeY [Gammaproteobacteria bacterium]